MTKIMKAENLLMLLENGPELNLSMTSNYAGILGESPSKGARSPSLWNKAFQGLGISARMHPLDIKKEHLPKIINALRDDPRFIGGAVAVPYKQEILPLLDCVEEEAKIIGAINCIYRDGAELVGTNTDGLGALNTLQDFLHKEDLTGKTVLIIGIGGAGRAVGTYIAKAVGLTGEVILSNRTAERFGDLVEKLAEYSQITCLPWPVENSFLKKAHIIINCSRIGFEGFQSDSKGMYSLRPFTPLGPVEDTVRVEPGEEIYRRYMISAGECILKNWGMTQKALAAVNHAVIFDIIYQPRETMLLQIAACYGLKTLNGEAMNLEQAVIAFCKTVDASKLGEAQSDSIRNFMIGKN